MTKLTQDRLNPLLVSDKPLTTIEEASAAYNKLVNQINFQLIPALDKNASKITLDATYMASTQSLEATDQIAHTYNTLPLEGKTAAVTLTSVPTITDGYDGERLLLIGMDDTKTVTLQDESSLTSSNVLNMGGANITLGKGDVVGYIFSEQTGLWEQMFQKTDDLTIAGDFTCNDITATGSLNLSGLTASQAVFTDASKNLVSNAITGSGNVVMSASPTLTGTIVGANLDLSGTLNVAGVTTLDTTTAGALVIGSGAAGVDYNITFDGETNDGVLTWMEDEDYFEFADDVVFDESVIIGPDTRHDGYVIRDAAEVETANAVQTTLDNITLLDENTYHAEALVVGVKSDGTDRASYHIAGTFYRTAAGVATLQGVVTVLHSAESNAAWDATFTVNGNDLRVSVTGVAATTIEWGCTLKYINMSN